ncbi:unnamed protein product [Paramecium sonneborni]|uniref:Uncharacterized protein n=1 Tax=Paramecium sonneborni TaxID=65129 RepID=A0A8S1K786_9CILI|nr:unnamed protein product [Paramecium sonneborni]
MDDQLNDSKSHTINFPEYQQSFIEESLQIGDIGQSDIEIFQITQRTFQHRTHQTNFIIFNHPLNNQKGDLDHVCFILNILNELITAVNVTFFQNEDNSQINQNGSKDFIKLERGSYYAKIYQQSKRLEEKQIQKIEEQIILPIQKFIREIQFEKDTLYDQIQQLCKQINKDKFF